MTATDVPAGLLDAMLAVQAEAPKLKKDKTAEIPTKNGGKYSYTYADLGTIVETVRPLLAKNGLVWTTKPSWLQGVGPSLKYKLAHAPSRESDEGEMPLMLDAEDAAAQDMGSAITYMRRYALCAVLDLVADSDDDGALATAQRRGGAAGGKARPASPNQVKFVKDLLKRKKATVLEIRAMLLGAGVAVPDGADVAALVDALTGDQASAMIEFLKDGKPVPSPEHPSDLPPAAPGEFEHAPVDRDEHLG